MKCKKCGSEKVSVQQIAINKNKKKGWKYWLLFGWAIDMMLWIFLTIPRLIIGIFKPKKIVTKVQTKAVCQNCGYSWRIRKM